MASIQQTLQQIAAQMRDLSTTAKLLIGSLMVILAMSLFLVALYAGRADMAPLPITFTPETRTQAVSYLERVNMPFEEIAGKILVPAEQRYTVLAQLTENEAIDADQIDFETLLQQESPFTSREQNRKRYLVVKMSVLGRTISQMAGVNKAVVVIDEPHRTTPIGRPDIAPSASVTVHPVGEALEQSKVDAIARLVAGAHAGLNVKRVAVIDARTGLAFSARSDADLSATKYMDVKLAAEKHVESNLQHLLGYIPGVRISVNAQVDTARVERRQDSFEEPLVGPLTKDSRSIAATNQPILGEPGVRSNAGIAITNPVTTSELIDERNSARTRPVFPQTSQHVMDAKGYPLKINTTISIPRSHIVAIYRRQQGDEAAEPNDQELSPTIASLTDSIRADVEPLIQTDAIENAKPGVVQVSMYHDFALAGFGGGIGAFGADGESGGGVFGTGSPVSDGLVRYISLGGLALLSMAMMFMMVRRASVREDLPTAEELVGIPPALSPGSGDLVGEADESPATMEGVEIDESDLERHQKLAQVNDLAMNNPGEAANMIRRWIKNDG